MKNACIKCGQELETCPMCLGVGGDYPHVTNGNVCPGCNGACTKPCPSCLAPKKIKELVILYASVVDDPVNPDCIIKKVNHD